MLPLKTELETRWLLNQFTDEKLFELYDRGWQKFYFGMDPTADSLHLGNFINFINAIHLMRRGNICIPLVGGATGMIGDPGGRDSERTFLSPEQLDYNFNAIKIQVWWLLDNLRQVIWEDLHIAPIVNNKDFYVTMSFLDFLRDVGKYITVNNMMTKETVKKRIEDPEQSISYTEFSYMLIQGYDFVRLYEDQWCKLQIAWSDQRWNITTGTELIRKKTDGEAYAFTCPLILDSNGKKFGKSAGNAIWLDPKKTSHYQLYQYFLNVTDEDVSRFLKLFTLLTMEEIDTIVTEHIQQPQLRIGQKALAYRVVQIIRGTDAAEQAQAITEFVFANDKLQRLKEAESTHTGIKGWKEAEDFLNALVEQVGGVQANEGDTILDVVVSSWLAGSRGDAKKLIQQNGISLNEVAVSDINRVIESSDWVNGVILLQKGKKNMRLIVK